MKSREQDLASLLVRMDVIAQAQANRLAARLETLDGDCVKALKELDVSDSVIEDTLSVVFPAQSVHLQSAPPARGCAAAFLSAVFYQPGMRSLCGLHQRCRIIGYPQRLSRSLLACCCNLHCQDYSADQFTPADPVYRTRITFHSTVDCPWYNKLAYCAGWSGLR